MKLKNVLIVVKDIERSRQFYHDLFGLELVLDNDGNHVDGIEYTDYENFSYRLDGNNVDMDTENVELASEQIRYNAINTSIQNEFSRFKSVLR